MLGRIAGIKPSIGKVEPPIVDVDGNSAYAFRQQRIDDSGSDIAFAAAVDPGERKARTFRWEGLELRACRISTTSD